MNITADPPPINGYKRNRWLSISVCMIGIMIASFWVIATPDGFMNKVDAVGYAVCHRILSHSFIINGRPMPLCARCTGMYLGALYGTVLQFMAGKRKGGLSRSLLIVLSLMGIIFTIDGLNSFAGLFLEKAPLYTPQNWLRLMTGLSMGVFISALIYPIFTQTVWRTWQADSAFGSIRSIIALLAGCILLAIGVLSGYSFILCPLALISIIGVMIILAMIYTVIMLMIFKQENSYNHFSELTPALIGAIILTMTQIGIFDWVRFLLTETWKGLPL
jgi:uncharacterized membrane protein